MEKRKEGETIIDYLKRTSIKDSGWYEKAKFRETNEYWLRDSFRISLFVNSFLRENKMELETLEKLAGFKVDLHGSHNWTIQEIRKLELLINRELV